MCPSGARIIHIDSIIYILLYIIHPKELLRSIQGISIVICPDGCPTRTSGKGITVGGVHHGTPKKECEGGTLAHHILGCVCSHTYLHHRFSSTPLIKHKKIPKQLMVLICYPLARAVSKIRVLGFPLGWDPVLLTAQRMGNIYVKLNTQPRGNEITKS